MKKYYVCTGGANFCSNCCDPEKHLGIYDCDFCDVYTNTSERILIASARRFNLGGGRYIIMKGYVKDERDSEV